MNHLGDRLSIKYPIIIGLIIDPSEAENIRREATFPVTGTKSSSVQRSIDGKNTDIENPTTGENIQIPVGTPNFVQRNIPIVPANTILI